MKRDYYTHTSALISACFYLLIMGSIASAKSKPIHELPTVVKSGNDLVRYFIHYDAFGRLPDSSYLETLGAKIKTGDEVEIRYYPERLFNLVSPRLNLPKDSDYESINAIVIFPPPVKNTPTIDIGNGSVYMLALGDMIYRLRLATTPSMFIIGQAVDTTNAIYQEVTSNTKLEAESIGERSRLPSNLPEDWNGKIFRQVDFKQGTLYLEIYSIAGDQVTLEASAGPYEVMEEFDGVRADHYLNTGPSVAISMQPRRTEGYYTAILSGEEMKAGMHAVNLRMDYKIGSFEQRMSPISYRDIPLKSSWDQLTVDSERELPSDFRIRPGIAVFNQGQEVRLITSFLFIRDPKGYFAENPGMNVLNPSCGLQIGGTGDQDLVFLLGGSLKVSRVGDIVFGFRFGLNPTQKWTGSESYYFGATIDPELFIKLNNK